MAIQYRGTGTSGNNGTASDTSVTITLPTGWQSGDLLFTIVRVGTAALTFSQSGTGTWTIDFTTSNAGASYTIAVAHRVMAGGDTAPTFSWGATGARQCWSCGGFFSDASGTLSLDAWAASDPVQVTTATSITPHAITGAGGTEASVILTGARATASGSAVSHTYTPPSGWTWNDGDGSFSAAGLNARFAAHCYQLGVSGTVTPAAETLTDSTSDTFFLAAYHALVSETGGGSTSGPNYAGSAADLGGGSGTWASTANADGAPDAAYATWTTP